MADIEIYLDDKLLEGISELAIKHYGGDNEVSRQHVVETALEMRILWSSSLKQGQELTDEAVSSWEFPESPVTGKNADTINDWLFRR
jgi:hypothetical protein